MFPAVSIRDVPTGNLWLLATLAWRYDIGADWTLQFRRLRGHFRGPV